MPIAAHAALSWQELALSQRERYQSFVTAEDLPSADFAFAALFMWNDTYRQQVSYVGNRAVVRIGADSITRYAYPVGEGSYQPLLTALREECALRGEPLIITGIPECALEQITEEAAFSHTVCEDMCHADYIYEAEALATLAGKKLHAKRNHINAFSKEHAFALLSLTEENRTVCRDILQKWVESTPYSTTVEAEKHAILRGLDHLTTLGLTGGVLLVDDAPAAFTVGEPVNSDTFCIHFEKALPELAGAYPVINREFVRLVQALYPTIRYINREDDMGLENLRRAKLSYRPCRMQRKFILIAEN